MPVVLLSELPLSEAEVEKLWQATIADRNFSDDAVAVKCLDEEEMRTLNRTYRYKDRSTNVLTFSYPATLPLEGSVEHDVVLCLPVAEVEADQRKMLLNQYVALLLAHAFLHVTGMDHEQSGSEAIATQEAEKRILTAAGFEGTTLQF